MSTSAVEKNPLNHYVTEVPSKNFFHLNSKKCLFKGLEIISYVALTAIMISIFFISYGAASLSTPPLLLIGIVLSTPLLTWGITTFSVKSHRYSLLAQTEGYTTQELQRISSWKTTQIEIFLKKEGVDPNQIKLDALRVINPEEPLCALLPLIARYRYLKQFSAAIREDSIEKPEQLEKDFQKMADEGRPIEDWAKEKTRYETQKVAQMRFWNNAIPTALNAAVILQIIQDPSNCELEIQQPNFEMKLPRIGKFNPQSFEAVLHQRVYHSSERREYFSFLPDLNRRGFTLYDFAETTDPSKLRLLLFPQAASLDQADD